MFQQGKIFSINCDVLCCYFLLHKFNIYVVGQSTFVVCPDSNANFFILYVYDETSNENIAGNGGA